jgi:long-chain fatty acid transport protein
MNRRDKLSFFAVMISGVCALKVSANGFALPDQDAFATARGEAFVATADNPSAIFYNPAGLTQLEGNNFRGGVYGIYIDSSYRPPSGAANSGQIYHDKDNLAGVPQLFYAYTPKDWPVSFGLGVYAPFGGSMSWPQSTGFRSVATEGSLEYITLDPAIAIKLPWHFSIGGGLMLNYGNLETQQGLLAAQSPLTNFFRFHGSGASLGYNVGLLWQPVQQISLGATFRSSARMNFDGHSDFQLQPRTYPSPAGRNADMDLTFPLTAVFGVSVRPTQKWNIEFDANYTDWSSFDQTIIRQAAPKVRNPFLQNIPVNLDWQASWIYEFGVTRYFDNGWHVSAGYAFNENSVPDKFYTPLAADVDRHLVSFGAGFKGKIFDVDLTYQFGIAPSHLVAGSQPSTTPAQFAGQSADGRYDFMSHAVMLTVGMHF